MKVENKLEISKFELTDVVEVKTTTADEGMAFSNSWRTYHERTDRLVRSRGKVYSLVLGQCTTVLLDEMKQDADWQVVSESCNPLALLKLLIGEIILKQSDNQYKICIIIELTVMFQVTSLLWLVNLKPAEEDALAVEGVDVGVDSPRSLPRKSGEVKMVSCYAHLRRSWLFILEPIFWGDACQEWLSEKQLVLQELTYPDSVLARHEVHQEKAVIDRVTKMVSSLKNQLQVMLRPSYYSLSKISVF
jgi:hypothetical protein